MPTSTRFAVSVHTLVLLGRRGGKPLRSEEIAIDVGTNPAVIRALLSRLSVAGLTASQRGSGGGAVLARAASRIRLLDVHLAVNERKVFNLHDSSPDDGQAIGRYVVACLNEPLLRARHAMETSLATVSIGDIIDGIARLHDGELHGSLVTEVHLE